MINYMLPPSPDLACRETGYAFRSFAFNDEQINKIIEIGEYHYRLEQATIQDPNNPCNTKVRNSKISWIGLSPETQFIYDQLGYIARDLNGQFFDLDLYGFTEEIQYTVYEKSADEGDPDGHYTWHVDKGAANSTPRKLSIVVQLSDPSEYEGGNLEVFYSGEPQVLKKSKGMLYAFPSYLLHRVTPVTAGIRRTLVVWLTGPKFR